MSEDPPLLDDAHDRYDEEEPDLQELVAYFVAAKKSLSATNHVYRANELVENARKSVEDGAIYKAKSTYMREGIGEQLRVLKNIHGGLDAVALEAQVDFQGVLKSLDAAHDRLQATLGSLRKTIISTSLTRSEDDEDHGIGGPLLAASTEESIDTPRKTLYDFIDESNHTKILDGLRSTIDAYNDNQASFHRFRSGIDTSLTELISALSAADTVLPTDAHPSIPEHFHLLSSNASEMATALESLISHYDLCITALKHTEGGGAAARAATHSLIIDPSSHSPSSLTESSLYASSNPETHRQPITPAERAEMLAVLRADAEQVPSVTAEIYERLAEMQTTLSQLQASTLSHTVRFNDLTSILARLSALSPTLATGVPTSLRFREVWTSHRASLAAQTDALAELTGVYNGFQASYAALLREVDRRAIVGARMRKVAERAQREMDALAAEDGDMRAQFLAEVGGLLPRDIWPGLERDVQRWEVRKVGGAVGLGIAQRREA